MSRTIAFFTISLALVAMASAFGFVCDDIPTRWVGTKSEVMVCLDSVPLEAQKHANTKQVLSSVLDAHYFTDIANANLAPYHIDAKSRSEWARIDSTNYANDWAAQNDFIKLFKSFGDASLSYIAPSKYSSLHVVAPYRLSSAWENGKQTIKTFEHFWNPVRWDRISPGSNYYAHLNKEVTKINDKPVLDWLEEYGAFVGSVADRGLRIQQALDKVGVPMRIDRVGIPEKDEIKYEFADGTSVTIKLAFGRWSFDDVDGGMKRDVARQTDVPRKTMGASSQSMKRNVAGGSASTIDFVEGIEADFEKVYKSRNSPVTSHSYHGVATVEWVPSVHITHQIPFKESLEEAARRGGNNTNLIISLIGNPRLEECIAHAALAFLAPEWRRFKTYGDNTPYSPFNWRKSQISETLWKHDKAQLFGGPHEYSNAPLVIPDTGVAVTDAQWNTNQTFSFGRSTYSPFFNILLCPRTYWVPVDAFVFDKIIIVTDGKCTGSCAYFISQLRQHNKVRIVSYGGEASSPLATYTSTGDTGQSWRHLASRAQERRYADAAGIVELKTDADVRFNMVANWDSVNAPLPRQSTRLEADYYLPYWGESSRKTFVDLYSSIIPIFDEIPSGLPSQ